MRGEARGEARSLHEGAELFLLGVLETRLGPVPAVIHSVLDRYPVEVLRDLAEIYGQIAYSIPCKPMWP